MPSDDRTDRGASRRDFLHITAVTGTGLLIAGCAGSNTGHDENAEQARGNQIIGEEGVSPLERLTREHGMLTRVMLVYDELARRIEANQDFSPDVLAQSAGIIRNFIEDCHEKLEEDFLFPRFRHATTLV
jgi:hypothetical protein